MAERLAQALSILEVPESQRPRLPVAEFERSVSLVSLDSSSSLEALFSQTALAVYLFFLLVSENRSSDTLSDFLEVSVHLESFSI